MTIINTNVSSLIGFNNLRQTALGTTATLEKLSTGLKVNRGGDDPSGLAIGKGMTGQIRGYQTAIQNIQDGISLVQTAEKSLAETQSIILRIRDLAVRACNDATLTDADRSRIQAEVDKLAEEFDRKSEAMRFNTKALFDGTAAGGLKLQVGADRGDNFTIDVTIPEINGTTIAGPSFPAGPLNFNTPGHSESIIEVTDYALEMTSNARADLGVLQRKLEGMVDELNVQNINVTAARSRIFDANIAEELAGLTRLQVLQQSGTAIVAQANAAPQSVLQLIK